jgi:hypothetical protein
MVSRVQYPPVGDAAILLTVTNRNLYSIIGEERNRFRAIAVATNRKVDEIARARRRARVSTHFLHMGLGLRRRAVLGIASW